MSGILDRIVRRRRASASSRLGPPPSNVTLPLNGAAHVNGAPSPVWTSPAAMPDQTDPSADELDGVLAPEPEAVGAPEPEAVAAPEPEAVAAPEPEAVAAPEPEAVAAPEPEHEPQWVAEPEPEPARLPAQTSELEALPGFLQRGRVRRRARYLRALREVQLRDLGGFMVELARFGRDRPELVQAKLAGALDTDRELRSLEQALGSEQPLRELREPGIGGACENCGAVHGSADRFCASCGEPLRSTPAESGEPLPRQAEE